MWMWMYTGIKVFLIFFRKPIHDFLSNFYWHFLSISNRFWDIWLQSFQGLTFRGHLRSKIFPLFESPYMNSYLTSIDTFSLSCPVFEIFDFKVWVWMWMWMYTGIKVFLTFFESSYMTSYLTSIDTFSLSQTVFEIFDFKVFRDWPWPLEVTWGQKYFHHSKAHKWIPI